MGNKNINSWIDIMDEMNEVYDKCEECIGEVNMMDRIVKETANGNSIYLP